MDYSQKSDPFPRLSTERCLLREVTPGHAEDLTKIFGDPETMRFMQQPLLERAEDCRDLILQWHHGYEQGKSFHWAVMLKDAPEDLAGVSALHYWSKENRRIELGSYIRRSHWGLGLSTEITRATIAFAFADLNVNRVELRCDPGNESSAAIARKLGMRLDGILREFVFVEGKGFCDEAVYSQLKGDPSGER